MTPAEKLFEETARVERIIWIPGAVADWETTPEEFRSEFCEDLPEHADAPLYAQLPELSRFSDEDEWPNAEEVAEALNSRTGFLVQAATPVMTPSSETSSTFSWSYYRTCWLYAASEAEIIPVIFEWVAQQRADEKTKATA